MAVVSTSLASQFSSLHRPVLHSAHQFSSLLLFFFSNGSRAKAPAPTRMETLQLRTNSGLSKLAGKVVTGVAFYLQTWVIEKRGPVFLAISTSLALVITVLVSSFLLCDTLTFGSILGGVLLVGGLYSVLRGKSRDKGQDQGSREPVVDRECSVIQEENSSRADIPI